MKLITTPLFFEKYANTFNKDIKVIGPGVDSMIQAIHSMLQLGPPDVRNDIGGSGVTYPVFVQFENVAPGTPLKWEEIIKGMQALQYHKNTQLPGIGIDYDVLRGQVVEDYNKALAEAGVQVSEQESGDRKYIRYLGPISNNGFNSYVFQIFDLKRYPNIKDAIRAEMDRRAANGERHYQKTTDNWGKFDNPVWKAFRKSKAQLDSFEIDPRFVAVVEPALREMGYDTSEMVKSMTSEEGTIVEEEQKKLTATKEGNNIVVDFNGYPGREAMDAIKNAGFRGKKTDTGGFLWSNSNPNVNSIEKFIDFMETLKYDCSELRALIEPLKTEEAETGERIRIRARDVSAETKGRWHMAISFLRKGTPEGEMLKEALRFSFPAWSKNMEDKEGGRTVNTTTWETFVSGNQQEYFNFMNTLDKRGFYTVDIFNILNKLTQEGLIAHMNGIGILDGYENDEDFYAELDNYQLPFELYPEQKEAIKRLYTHASFMRGDETGAGKTVTSVLAADMRMKQSGGRAVVITKVAVQDQFMEAIAEFLQLDINDRKQISIDPLDKALWTVLTYHQFSQPAQPVEPTMPGMPTVEQTGLNGRVDFTNELVAQAKAGEIQCVLLDEIHNVKNGKEASRDPSPERKHKSNHRTFNVQDFTANVPFNWGLSATIVANKPIDVYNQLKAVGHPLGKISWGRFAKDFGGMTVGQYGMEAGTIEQQLAAVSRLKEYLFDQEAYDALGKKQLNVNMPEQVISQDSIPVDQDTLWGRIANRIAGFKKPDLAVSQMQAFRNEAAIIKAPQTVQEAIPTLEKGEKIMIFSDFKDSLERIRSGLQAYFDQRGLGEQVVTIKGGMRKKTRKFAIDTFKDVNSKARAIVINIVAGGTGLDFPNIVTQAIVNDYDWSVANDEQMLGRNYRINSLHDVYVKYMIAEGTPDEDYYARLADKKKIANIIHKMSREEDARLKEGGRGHTDKELAELQKHLAEMKKRLIQMDSQDKSFDAGMASKIRGEVKKKASGNWYGKKKFGK